MGSGREEDLGTNENARDTRAVGTVLLRFSFRSSADPMPGSTLAIHLSKRHSPEGVDDNLLFGQGTGRPLTYFHFRRP